MDQETTGEEQRELFEPTTHEPPKPTTQRTRAQKIIDLDPTRCRLWYGNPRRPDRLNDDELNQLATSIHEIGQTVPVIAREVGDFFEVIAGSRRLAAVEILHREQKPEIALRAEVRAVNDEEAYQLALSENEGRTELTTFENAISVKAYSTRYQGSQAQLAKMLGKSDTWVSRHLSIAEQLGPHFDAFPDWHSISFRIALELSTVAKRDSGEFSSLIAKIQSDPRKDIKELFSTFESVRKPKQHHKKKISYGSETKPHLIVQKTSSKGMTLTIPKYDVMDPARIEKAFAECLAKMLEE